MDTAALWLVASLLTASAVALPPFPPKGPAIGPSFEFPVHQETTLPWPAVAMGEIYLPFGLRWFQEGAREAVKGFGEAECGPQGCRWMADRPEGTVWLEQSYHQGSLVGFRLEYVLMREQGLPYLERVRDLRDSMERDDWVVTSLEDPLMGIVMPQHFFRGESKDTRVEVRAREGEHSVTVSLEMRAK